MSLNVNDKVTHIEAWKPEVGSGTVIGLKPDNRCLVRWENESVFVGQKVSYFECIMNQDSLRVEVPSEPVDDQIKSIN